jgi:uncharacterized protein Yka (UPF0111/DUF47 family)
MSFRASLLRFFNRAREEATEVARTARIKLDIRQLEGRRDSLFRDIGRKVYTSRGEILPMTGLESFFDDISKVEKQIRVKKDELKVAKEATEGTDGPAATKAASA